MPSYRLPHLRRPVVVLCALLLGLLILLAGPVSEAAASPHVDDLGPVLTLPSDVTFVVGVPGAAYTIEAEGDPVPAVGVDRLPAGLRLMAHGDGSATIAGTPTGPPGTSTVTVRAQTAEGSASATLTVSVQQAPAFIDRDPVVFVAGEFASVAVRTVGYPAPGIGLDGDLPAGLTFVDNGDGTATIAGTPVGGPGSSPVTLTAVNVVSDVALTRTIQVVARPDVVGAAGPIVPATDGPQREP